MTIYYSKDNSIKKDVVVLDFEVIIIKSTLKGGKFLGFPVFLGSLFMKIVTLKIRIGIRMFRMSIRGL